MKTDFSYGELKYTHIMVVTFGEDVSYHHYGSDAKPGGEMRTVRSRRFVGGQIVHPGDMIEVTDREAASLRASRCAVDATDADMKGRGKQAKPIIESSDVRSAKARAAKAAEAD